MTREEISRPVRLALASKVITTSTSVFDYGCGRGGDVERLTELDIEVTGWDPAHRPDAPKTTADVVNLGFVVNVIEDVVERRKTLLAAWRLAKRTLLVSARLTHERDAAHVARHGDGWATSKGTFQKFFEHEELRQWIEENLGHEATPAALGTFFVFRDARDRQLFESARLRSYSMLERFERNQRLYHEHDDLFARYEEFVAERGRPPIMGESEGADQLAALVGSHTRVMNAILAVRSLEWWDAVTLARRKDLYVQLALEAFRGRQRFGSLAVTLQRDVKSLAGTYKAACEQADRLLMAVGNERARELAIRVSTVGKLTGNALYLHVGALPEAPVLLRMYEACARQLTGEIAGNVIKFWRGEPGISYLQYPAFDEEAHPSLAQSTVVDLLDRSVRVSTYGNRANPPVLHRKEEFLSTNDERRTTWRALTLEEEAAGLYAEPATIGTRHGWEAALTRADARVEGHSLVRDGLR
jgi:DNA phosphorothioation-associated putative methyltransferase